MEINIYINLKGIFSHTDKKVTLFEVRSLGVHSDPSLSSSSY